MVDLGQERSKELTWLLKSINLKDKHLLKNQSNINKMYSYRQKYLNAKLQISNPIISVAKELYTVHCLKEEQKW